MNGTLEEKLKYVHSRLTEARKAKNEVKASLWRCLLGDWETEVKRSKKPLTIENFHSLIKGHQKGLQVLMDVSTNPHSAKHLAMWHIAQSDYDDLERLLPQMMTEEKLRDVILQCKGIGLDMGKTMKYLKETYPSQYDGKLASTLAKEIL